MGSFHVLNTKTEKYREDLGREPAERAQIAAQTLAGKARAAKAKITSTLPQLWRHTNLLVKVRNGALT